MRSGKINGVKGHADLTPVPRETDHPELRSMGSATRSMTSAPKLGTNAFLSFVRASAAQSAVFHALLVYLLIFGKPQLPIPVTMKFRH